MVEQLLENFDETLRNQTDIVMEMKPQGDRQGTGERNTVTLEKQIGMTA